MTTYEGTDIKLDFVTNDIIFNSSNSFQMISGVDNVIQAIKTRVLTKLLSLATHKTFGCEIYSIIGETSSEYSKAEASSYIYDAIMSDPRVNGISSINIDYRKINNNNAIIADVVVEINDEDAELNFVISA